ncbi:hypothetical protein ABK040_010509 [Willaertia magna]
MAIKKHKSTVSSNLRKKLVSTRTIEKNKTWNKATSVKKQVKLAEKRDTLSKIKPMIVHKPKESSGLFFSHNVALGPPYRILLDTNFINFSIQNKLDIVKASMDCLCAKCIPCITDCVIAELEKLGTKFKVALKAAKDPRIVRLKCTHKGCYADDCIVNRVSANPIYIVGTCDKDLKRRIRKVPGVPIMYIKSRQYSVERLPDVDKMCGPRL